MASSFQRLKSVPNSATTVCAVRTVNAINAGEVDTANSASAQLSKSNRGRILLFRLDLFLLPAGWVTSSATEAAANFPRW